MKGVVCVTGANGGIGQGLCSEFKRYGYRVIATDIDTPDGGTENLAIDLEKCVLNGDYREMILHELKRLTGSKLSALINNAAVQVVAPIEKLDVEEFLTMQHVNVVAPYLLSKEMLVPLKGGDGVILNIGSVHSRLTKPGFIGYSTSKSGIEGLTRALAVEIGSMVRVNAISPAAIDTKMLREGFGNSVSLEKLKAYHPVNEIGKVSQVAAVARFLVEESGGFLNGSIIGLDGGIASRLHDPC